jgi:GNAT superfamily N-acetyltransferase
MLADGLIIRRADPGDAAPLAALGARTFADAFGAFNTPEDLNVYLAATYGPEQQRAELANPDVTTLIVEHEATPIAFSQVRRGAAPASVTLPAPREVWRFYVDRRWHGRGVAGALMSHALDAARQLGGRSAWLSVWERNPRAIAFYTKCGFHDFGTKIFIVGADHQTDRVMAREIGDGSAV